MLAVQQVTAAVRDSTNFLAHWIFSFKYFVSALTMPALFGGEPIKENTLKKLAITDKVLWYLCILIPIIGYSFIFVSKAVI